MGTALWNAIEIATVDVMHKVSAVTSHDCINCPIGTAGLGRDRYEIDYRSGLLQKATPGDQGERPWQALRAFWSRSDC